MALYRVPHLGTFAWQLSVIAEQNNPPVSPAKGDRYAVSDSPSGAWVGHAFTVATYDGSGWTFDSPTVGWAFWDVDLACFRYYSGSAWAYLKIIEANLSLSDSTLKDVSTSAHGFCPKAPNDTTKFLRGDGSWAAPAGGGLGYALPILAANLTPVSDGATYYFGGQAGIMPQTTSARARIYIPKAGTIKVLYLFVWPGTTGSPEEVSAYLRKNDSSDTSLGTIDLSSTTYLVAATSLSVSVNRGDYVELKLVCPTFSTNPNNVRFSGVIYIE